MELFTELLQLESMGCDIILTGPNKFEDKRSLRIEYHERVGGYLIDVRKDISKQNLMDIANCIQAICSDMKKLDIRKGTD